MSQLPFAVDPGERVEVPAGLRRTGVSPGNGIYSKYFNQLLFEIKHDHVLGTTAQLALDDATVKYQSSDKTFRDSGGTQVNFDDNERILIIGLDALTDDLDFPNKILNIRMHGGVQIDLGTYDLNLPGTTKGDLDVTGTGSAVNVTASKGLQVDLAGTSILNVTAGAVLRDGEFIGKTFVPVGSLVAVNPNINVGKAIDVAFFVRCDNTGGNVTVIYPDGTTDSIALPDLSDSRFLMGGTAAGSGGSNVLIDHTHTVGNQSASHTHSHDHSSQNSSTNTTTHTHTTSPGKGTFFAAGGSLQVLYWGAAGGSVWGTSGDSPNHIHPVNLANQVSGNQSASHNHSVGSGSAPGSTSSLPKYFTALYYMRLK